MLAISKASAKRNAPGAKSGVLHNGAVTVKCWE
jgi:hypothetical protein